MAEIITRVIGETLHLREIVILKPRSLDYDLFAVVWVLPSAVIAVLSNESSMGSFLSLRTGLMRVEFEVFTLQTEYGRHSQQ